jgi:Fe-S-cluster containining protein
MNELKDSTAATRFAVDSTTNTLKRSTDVDSCVALTEKLDRSLDAALTHAKQSLGAPVACRAGCSFCCHLRVEVLAHEAIALFRFLKTQIPEEQARAIAAKVVANADRVATMTPEQHAAARIQCAFLLNGRCSAYRARPLPCAGFHSLNVSECEHAYDDAAADLASRIPMVGEIKEMEVGTAIGIRQALRALKLDDQPMELHTALAALLREPGLIGRWRNGRSLIKKVD